MPTIVNADETHITAQGDGWHEMTLVSRPHFSTHPMIARRWVFDPGARGPEKVHGDMHQLLYVIRGSGTAIANDEELPLDHESILWLEPGDRYVIVAGDEGIELLQGYAPGDDE